MPNAHASTSSATPSALLPSPLPAFLHPEAEQTDPQEAAIRRELAALARLHSDARVADAQGRIVKSLAGCRLCGDQHNSTVVTTCLERLLDHKFSRMFHSAKCQQALREGTKVNAGDSHGEDASELLPPLDANKVKSNVDAGRYETADDLMRDTRKVWSDAMLRVEQGHLLPAHHAR